MNTIEIDRIILTGLDVSPERAERIRSMVEIELQRLLEREAWPGRLIGVERTRLGTLPMNLVGTDSGLAQELAQRVAQALQNVG